MIFYFYIFYFYIFYFYITKASTKDNINPNVKNLF